MSVLPDSHWGSMLRHATVTYFQQQQRGGGTAFGGKSLADIFGEHKAHKNDQILEKHPYRFLYGAYKEIVILCIYRLW